MNALEKRELFDKLKSGLTEVMMSKEQLLKDANDDINFIIGFLDIAFREGRQSLSKFELLIELKMLEKALTDKIIKEN